MFKMVENMTPVIDGDVRYDARYRPDHDMEYLNEVGADVIFFLLQITVKRAPFGQINYKLLHTKNILVHVIKICSILKKEQ